MLLMNPPSSLMYMMLRKVMADAMEEIMELME